VDKDQGHLFIIKAAASDAIGRLVGLSHHLYTPPKRPSVPIDFYLYSSGIAKQ